MAVNLSAPSTLYPVAGVKLATAAAGIRYQGRDDVLLIELAAGSQTVAVFTQNAFCAAPVTVAKQRLELSAPRALLVNSGNANCGTGEAGLQATLGSTGAVAQALGVETTTILPFSTGVIGELLPVEPFQQVAAGLVSQLAEDAWLPAAKAIMTTDTLPKGASQKVRLSGGEVTLTGIAKGSGMICPNMATMLGYVASDVNASTEQLQRLLSAASDASFNAITVDGDTSTNDACTLTATGAAGVELTAEDEPIFYQALLAVMQQLAQAIIRDGEGATKFVAVQVTGAESAADAKAVAYTVAQSPLVKTALFASDPNWGRILAAVGRAPVAGLQVDSVTIRLDDVLIVEAGGVAASYTEAAGQAVFNQAEITINIDLGVGTAAATVWTSDLSHDYVRINAEYRS